MWQTYSHITRTVTDTHKQTQLNNKQTQMNHKQSDSDDYKQTQLNHEHTQLYQVCNFLFYSYICLICPQKYQNFIRIFKVLFSFFLFSHSGRVIMWHLFTITLYYQQKYLLFLLYNMLLLYVNVWIFSIHHVLNKYFWQWHNVIDLS